MNRRLKAKLLKMARLRRSVQRALLRTSAKLQHSEHTFMVIAALLIGVLAALGAIGFRYLIALSHEFFFQQPELSMSFLDAMPWWQRLMLPFLGGLIVGPIAHFIAHEVRGSGVPDVMESVAVRAGHLRSRIIVAKAAAAAFTIGSGGSAGREGPIIQIGSAIGSIAGKFISVSAQKMRTFVACGAAGAIAATFNAPIAGALFAVEVIVGDFAVAQFTPIVISSVCATVLSRHFIGDSPAFDVPQYEVISSFEFIPYTLLGILAGFIAVTFIISLYKSTDLFDTLPLPSYLRPAIGGLGVGLIALIFPQVYGVGYETIGNTLQGIDVGPILLVLLVVKLVATALTLGSGGCGGVFAPSLFIGAMLGGAIGAIAHDLRPDLISGPGAYALVGMGALVAGTTHAPISAILMIFELTNDYRIIPPLMIACTLSVLLSTYLKKESIYTQQLARRGMNIFKGKDVNMLRGIKVRDVVSEDVEKVYRDQTFSDLVGCMIRSDHQIYFVIDREQQFIGSISLQEVKEFLKDESILSGLVIAADLAHPSPAVLKLSDNLDLVMHHFGRHNVDELPVVDDANRLVGSLRRKTVIDAYNKQIFKWDLAGGMHSVVTAVKDDRAVEIAEGYVISEIEPPSSFVGKSLRQLKMRAQFELEIILIRKAVEGDEGLQNRPGAIPTPDYEIVAGDKLLVLGSRENIDRLQHGTREKVSNDAT